MHYYRTNEVGVRDDDALCQQPDILLFGDSNVFAHFLPFSETLGEQLEDAFDDAVCSVNFGVPGYGPDQSLLRMLYEVEHLDLTPKVIVFHVFADNDYGDLLRNYLFTVDDSGNLQATKRDRTDFKLRAMERLQAQYLLVRRLRDLAINAGLYRMPADEYLPDRAGVLEQPPENDAEAMRDIAALEKVTLAEFENYRQGKYTTWLGDIYDFNIALNPESDAARQAELLLLGVFNEAREKSKALNACFVVLIQPSEYDVSELGILSHVDLARYSEMNNRSYQPRNLTDIARRAAESSGVDYINLFDIYENSAQNVYEPFEIDKGDNHWNAAGVRMAAGALHDYMLEKGCLGAEPAGR
jgi:hypothetical protein